MKKAIAARKHVGITMPSSSEGMVQRVPQSATLEPRPYKVVVVNFYPRVLDPDAPAGWPL